ncbi:MAG TPA: universal stress protein [Nitrospiria bacterium]|nr:universal stress protein [Candidatus Manganitrophaceae bacterium]HIL35573.1 universal stress protein [Candidatus Manganitrophaceae bacterium]
MQMKKILVATDFSPFSERALDYAVGMAVEFDADLLLVHVIESLNYSLTDTMTVVGHEKALSVTATALLENLVKQLSEKTRSVGSFLVSGTPYREIIKKSKEEDVDLIIVGTHGRTGVEHLLLGSVAEKVIRLATCPVLTVPAS